jgi:hypothetical protein
MWVHYPSVTCSWSNGKSGWRGPCTRQWRCKQNFTTNQIIVHAHTRSHLLGSQCMHQCWAVLECWPGSPPGSHSGSPNEIWLTLLNVRTGLKTDIRFSHDREPVQVYTFLRIRQVHSWNSDPVLRVLRIIYWFLLFFFSLGTPTLLLFTITFLPLLYFSLYYYYFFPIALIIFLVVAVTFLTFRLMKSFNY